MTYLAGSEIGAGAALARAEAVDRRVRTAIATSQTFLVIRILSVLLLIAFLPPRLPTVTLHLMASGVVTVPLGGVTNFTALGFIALISAAELYFVYRLADRARTARSFVLVVESLAILASAVALAVGALIAALPLTTSMGASGLLLLNQVRWAFRLHRDDPRSLTGRRQGGVFAGYAALPLDAAKAPQRVGYTSSHRRGA